VVRHYLLHLWWEVVAQAIVIVQVFVSQMIVIIRGDIAVCVAVATEIAQRAPTALMNKAECARSFVWRIVTALRRGWGALIVANHATAGAHHREP